MLVSQVLPEAILVKLPFTIQLSCHKLPFVNISFSEVYYADLCKDAKSLLEGLE